MIAHNQSGIQLAVSSYDRANHQQIRDMAGAIELRHLAEIEEMETWLADWFGL